MPFADGSLPWPGASDRVLFLRARGGGALPEQAAAWVCEQSFRPDADALSAAGFKPQARVSAGEPLFQAVLVLPPRQRGEARALLARALQHVDEGGLVLVSMANSEGAKSTEADLAHLAGPVRSLPKNKCRVFWVRKQAAEIDMALQQQWARLDDPQPILDGRFVSRPGLFAWDRIDPASALLAGSLPADLAGQGADLGAGYGYLSAEILARCPGVRSLALFEAEARALSVAMVNLRRERERLSSEARLSFHWHDVSRGIPGSYDFIVSNPPFHIGAADRPDLGRAFIGAAAAALRPGGSLWLVANRHLPYEAALADSFAAVHEARQQDGFKLIHAVKAGA